jgi:hypothetical protein
MSPPGELAFFLAIGAIGLGFTFGPIGAAIARRIAGSARSNQGRADVASLGPQVTAELDDLRGRLAEVEERLDFAERVLARGGTADQIPGGAQR